MKNIRNLVFDLDDTLYSKSLGYSAQYHINMVQFIEDKMSMSRETFIKLIREAYANGKNAYQFLESYGINFYDYMKHCESDMRELSCNYKLKEQLKKLPHNTFLFSDAHRKHVQDTLIQLELNDFFKNVYTITEANYIWKSYNGAFENFLKYYNLKPTETVIFEDNLKNLENAKNVGMKTILISEEPIEKPEFCDFLFKDINSALEIFTQNQ